MSIINSKKVHFYKCLSFIKKIFLRNRGVFCTKHAKIDSFPCICERQNIRPKKKGVIRISNLTSKERLFCTYYCLSRNGTEAASKSGYIFPEKSALRLLRKKEIKEEIERSDREKRASQKDIISGYYRLAFGCYADAVSLLFRDEVTDEEIRQMDLYNISDIKRKKGGDIEIKFFDRLKALERLQQLSCQQDSDGTDSLFSAIEKSAEALRDESDE